MATYTTDTSVTLGCPLSLSQVVQGVVVGCTKAPSALSHADAAALHQDSPNSYSVRDYLTCSSRCESTSGRVGTDSSHISQLHLPQRFRRDEFSSARWIFHLARFTHSRLILHACAGVWPRAVPPPVLPSWQARSSFQTPNLKQKQPHSSRQRSRSIMLDGVRA